MPEHEWTPAPPTVRQRIVAGAAIVLFLVVGANNLFGWRIFGGYDKQALAVVVLGMLVLVTKFMPTVWRS